MEHFEINISKSLHDGSVEIAGDVLGDVVVEGPDAWVILFSLEDLMLRKDGASADCFCGSSEGGEMGETGRRGKERSQVNGIAIPRHDLHVTIVGVARSSVGAALLAQSRDSGVSNSPFWISRPTSYVHSRRYRKTTPRQTSHTRAEGRLTSRTQVVDDNPHSCTRLHVPCIPIIIHSRVASIPNFRQEKHRVSPVRFKRTVIDSPNNIL